MSRLLPSTFPILSTDAIDGVPTPCLQPLSALKLIPRPSLSPQLAEAADEVLGADKETLTGLVRSGLLAKEVRDIVAPLTSVLEAVPFVAPITRLVSSILQASADVQEVR